MGGRGTPRGIQGGWVPRVTLRGLQWGPSKGPSKGGIRRKEDVKNNIY